MKNGNEDRRLLSLVERIEHLEDEKRDIADQIRDVKQEAKSAGYDVKVLNAILRERRMSQAERQEYQSILELYRAALGMLDGTPLGDFARQRLMPAPPERGDPPKSGDPSPADEDSAPAAPSQPDPAPVDQLAGVDLPAARAMGEADHAAGKRVIDNPFRFGDPRRAQWDGAGAPPPVRTAWSCRRRGAVASQRSPISRASRRE